MILEKIQSNFHLIQYPVFLFTTKKLYPSQKHILKSYTFHKNPGFQKLRPFHKNPGFQKLRPFHKNPGF